jgi:hypothetical protein
MTQIERTAVLNQLAKAQNGHQLDELTSSIAEAYKPTLADAYQQNGSAYYAV